MSGKINGKVVNTKGTSPINGKILGFDQSEIHTSLNHMIPFGTDVILKKINKRECIVSEDYPGAVLQAPGMDEGFYSVEMLVCKVSGVDGWFPFNDFHIFK